MQYVTGVCAACACMREVDRAGRVVRWNNRKYIRKARSEKGWAVCTSISTKEV